MKRLFNWSTLTLFLWLFFIAGSAFFGFYIYAVSVNMNNWFGEMPSLALLENPPNEVASEVYTADGVLLGKYFRENRTPVDFEELSPNLVKALVATEDARFDRHSGLTLGVQPGYCLKPF